MSTHYVYILSVCNGEICVCVLCFVETRSQMCCSYNSADPTQSSQNLQPLKSSTITSVNQSPLQRCAELFLWSTEKPHWSLGLSSLFWQNMINKTPLRREGVQCSVFLLLLVVEFNQGLQVNHVARVEIYSTSTSQPGICFLNPDDVFLGVVEFVDLRSDKEVDETWDEKKKEQTKSIIYLTFHRVVLSPMFMFLMMMMMMMMMMMSIYLNLNIHFYSQQKWGYITWEPGGGLIIRP